MKRRTFLAGLIALPVAAKVAFAIPSEEASIPQTPGLYVEGQLVEAGPIFEAWRDGLDFYRRSYQVAVGTGVTSVEVVKRNGRVVYDRMRGIYDPEFMGRVTFHTRPGGVHCMAVKDDDVTSINGAVPQFSFVVRSQ